MVFFYSVTHREFNAIEFPQHLFRTINYYLKIHHYLPLQAQEAIKNETAREEALTHFSEKCSISNIKVAGDLLVCKQVR